MEDGVRADEVRNDLLACAKSNGEVVPTTNDKEEHKIRRLYNDTFRLYSPCIKNHLLLNAVVFRFTSRASPVTAREVDWPCSAQFYVFGCDFWRRC